MAFPNAQRQLVAVDKSGRQVLFVDPAKQTCAGLRMPIAPHEMVLSPDGRTVYVSIYGSGTYDRNPVPGFEIWVIDVATKMVVNTIDISPYTSPHGLTFDRFGVLWTTCDRHGVVLGIEAETGRVLSVVETGSVGTHWVLATPDGSKLFTSNKQDGFVGVINPLRREGPRRIAVPHGTEGICFSPDGRWLFAADRGTSCVLRIDAETEALVETIVLADLKPDGSRDEHHMRLRVSGDGAVLAVAAYHYDRLVLIDTADTARQRTLVTGSGPMALAFDPFGKKNLYFSNHDEGSMAVVDLEAGRIVETFACGAGVESMDFASVCSSEQS